MVLLVLPHLGGWLDLTLTLTVVRDGARVRVRVRASGWFFWSYRIEGAG